MLFYFGLFGVLGFFIFGPLGELYGLALAASLIILTLLLGDRLYLVAIGAKEVDPRAHDIYFKLQNMSCIKSLSEVRLYRSHLIPVNTYCLDPIFNKPCIILSDQFLESNDEELCDICLIYSLTFLEKGFGKFSNIITFLTSVLLAPTFALNRIGLQKLSVLVYFIFLPMVFLKDYICEASLRESFKELEGERSLRVTYYLERFRPVSKTIINSVANDLSMFKKRDSGLWPSLLGSYANIFNNYVKWHERKN